MVMVVFDNDEASAISAVLYMAVNGVIPVDEQTEKTCRNVISRLTSEVY